MQFKDQVIVITGAGAGIGRATAIHFAEAGARVIAGDIDADRLESLRVALREHKLEIICVPGDVARAGDAARLVETAIQAYGRVDVLCNNAGVMDGFTSVGSLTDALWRRVLGVNLDGPMFTCRAALPRMISAGRGVIVNVASVAGLVGGVAGAAYTTSKHGLIGLTRNIAWQYATRGIRCVAVCPGGVTTSIDVSHSDDVGWERAQVASGSSVRVAAPEEIARVILFLASSEASFVNGAAIPVDGGWLAGG
ncbi:MAG TPA: SDR family NAD(P)-dependent oxidoreductase [Opitutaceae bacterium]|nr:SDR family NAD(P)-dependent oxidoreductase [Opitutaceae bacterium]